MTVRVSILFTTQLTLHSNGRIPPSVHVALSVPPMGSFGVTSGADHARISEREEIGFHDLGGSGDCEGIRVVFAHGGKRDRAIESKIFGAAVGRDAGPAVFEPVCI